MASFDYAIVGGGIVGLAAAYQLNQRFPQASLLVLEKEAEVGAHQTGHNSGVLHSGIYYRPGSLKAINCRQGKLAMEAFCAAEQIPYEICGKVIVAVDEREQPALQSIYERGQANGVQCELISQERLAELEPHANGIQAIHVPEAGIVNYRRVAQRLAEKLVESGHTVKTGTRVRRLQLDGSQVVLQAGDDEYRAGHVINCAGLFCDRVARLAGNQPESKIVPFRGEYYDLLPVAHHLCRHLIYPVPDPNFPFLGVHFTRMIDGGVECGPNAVLAFAREGYRKWNVNVRDLFESLTYPGFLRLATRYWRVGAGEMWRSISKRAFVKALQRLVPEITAAQLVPARAGVRAQAIGRDGGMVDDFAVYHDGQFTHVANAPSPAATSALNIGNLIVDRVADETSV